MDQVNWTAPRGHAALHDLAMFQSWSYGRVRADSGHHAYQVIDGQQRLSLLVESLREIAYFSASARELTRAAQRQAGRHRFTAAHELGRWLLTSAVPVSPDVGESWFRKDPFCFAAAEAYDADPGPAVGSYVGGLYDTTTEFARIWTIRLAIQRQAERAQTVVGQVLNALAMAAHSRIGVATIPLPTQSPGELVRSHPRVPRGPGRSVSFDLWPTGGKRIVV